MYGYVLDPPAASDQQEFGQAFGSGAGGGAAQKARTYRAEKTYGVSSGKWYDFNSLNNSSHVIVQVFF